ncbi:AbiJ-NTD4 domain-containing protein [Microbacterium sp. NPDC079176]|uniref:AbiJ-NTD4 domain-containing protein n=1 Tax=Microbacterium sp. NPDC079176 TaxID=3154768 RepID=UPI00342B6435
MASFSERTGHRATRALVQSDDLDTETRTELWNVLVLLQETFRKRGSIDPAQKKILDAVWERQFKRARDERPSDMGVWSLIKKQVLSAEWFDVLDLIEAIVKYMNMYPSGYDSGLSKVLAEAYNSRFEHYLVGYRFIGEEVTPIDSSAEAGAVTTASSDVASIAGARHHLGRAIELLADRQNPDYPNSIKESISSVEAVVKKVTGEGTLGSGLGKLESAGLTIHPALKGAWLKMYGWTSDDDGIRHGGIEAANADQALARYVLVTCSAFVSYLIEEGRKRGLLQ